MIFAPSLNEYTKTGRLKCAEKGLSVFALYVAFAGREMSRLFFVDRNHNLQMYLFD